MNLKLKIKNETLNLKFNDLLLVLLACIPLDICASFFGYTGFNQHLPPCIFNLLLFYSYYVLNRIYGKKIVSFLNRFFGGDTNYHDYLIMELFNEKLIFLIFFSFMLTDIIMTVVNEYFVFSNIRIILVIMPFTFIGKYREGLLFTCIMVCMIYISVLLEGISLIIVLAIKFYLSSFATFQIFYGLIIKYNSEFSKIIPIISYYD